MAVDSGEYRLGSLVTDFDFVLSDDYLKTLEAWPIAGCFELDHLLVARLHRFIIDPLMPHDLKVRALVRMGQVLDKPGLTSWEDVQSYIDSCQDA